MTGNGSNDTGSNWSNESVESLEIVSIEASDSMSNSSGWWRLRTWTDVDTSGGPARPAYLRLTCDVGLPAGPQVLHNCDNKQPWQECMAWCERGYSGLETSFLCVEDRGTKGTNRMASFQVLPCGWLEAKLMKGHPKVM